RVVILRQANRGPGAARNLALDSLDADIDAVAFLDSDDAWTEGHLRRAEAALAAGADFYFADHKREDDPVGRFAQCAYRPEGAPIAAGAQVCWSPASAVFRAILRRSPVGTSTVVIRRSAIGSRRFRTVYRAAGEDSIFWLEVLEQDVRAACGLTCDADYGRGVSVFNHRSWGDARSLATTLDEMRAQHHFRRRFRLDPDLAAESRAQCARLDVSFCANLLACARRRRWDAAGPALRYLGHRPWALAQMPRALRQALARPEAAAAPRAPFVGDASRRLANGPGRDETTRRKGPPR
ncbi:MAG: hypothetical protein JWQ97_3973, partial [Phenylobacterium sp.]|nr:hypothetical protein [Phenylobacterium sp.]